MTQEQYLYLMLAFFLVEMICIAVVEVQLHVQNIQPSKRVLFCGILSAVLLLTVYLHGIVNS